MKNYIDKLYIVWQSCGQQNMIPKGWTFFAKLKIYIYPLSYAVPLKPADKEKWLLCRRFLTPPQFFRRVTHACFFFRESFSFDFSSFDASILRRPSKVHVDFLFRAFHTLTDAMRFGFFNIFFRNREVHRTGTSRGFPFSGRKPRLISSASREKRRFHRTLFHRIIPWGGMKENPLLSPSVYTNPFGEKVKPATSLHICGYEFADGF